MSRLVSSELNSANTTDLDNTNETSESLIKSASASPERKYETNLTTSSENRLKRDISQVLDQTQTSHDSNALKEENISDKEPPDNNNPKIQKQF